MWERWRNVKRKLFTAAGLVWALSHLAGVLGTPLSLEAAQNANVGISLHILNPPNAITDLRASPVGSPGEVQLLWTAPSNDNRIAIDRYQLRYATYPAVSPLLADSWWNALPASQKIIAPALSPGTIEFTTVSGLTLQVTYYFGIRSVDFDGMISPVDIRIGNANQAASRPAGSDLVTPPTPNNFIGVALSTFSIQWTWDAANYASFYNLTSSPDDTFILQTPSLSATEATFTPNQLVSRTLSAGNANGISTPTSPFSVYTLAAVPTNLRATSLAAASATIAWDTNGNPGLTSYRVERSLDGVSYAVLTVLTSLSYNDTGLTELTSYYYRLRAINGNGIPTSPSPPLILFTRTSGDFNVPLEPQGLKGNLDPTGKAFTLLWEPVTLNVDGTQNTDLVGYNVYRRSLLDETPTKITPTPVRVSVFADQVDGHTYYYTIRAIDNAGNESADSLIADSSPFSNIIFLGADQISSVHMPSIISDLLRSAHNKYGVPLTIQMNEEPLPSQTEIVRNVRLSLVRGDNKKALNDLAFAAPQAVVGIGYSLVNGQIGRGSPLSESSASAVTTSATPDKLSIYWNNGVTWVKVGGTLDTRARVIKTKSSFLGNYQLRIAARATSLSLSQGNVFPRLFSPNGDGYNDRVYFVLENPNNTSVTGEIYDLQGREVAKLPPPTGTGIGTTLIWDGKDSNGNAVPSGAYIYKIRGEGKTFSGTVGVAR